MTQVLIVDDHEQNLYLLQALLQGHGYEVRSARNGIEALDMARREAPDLIVTDILMPGMDGFSLCREWTADERLRRVPLVFYTATYTDPQDEAFALSLGAARFIVKPTEPDAFVEILRQVLENHAAQRLVSPNVPSQAAEVYYQQYNQALIRKLEDRMAQLEEANRLLKLDITERKRAEDALRESEAQFRALAEQSITGTTVIQEGKWVYVNPRMAEMFGYTQDGMIGMQPVELVVEADRETVRESLRKRMSGEIHSDHYTFRARRKDGSEMDLEVYGSTLTYQGRPAVLSTLLDITERGRAEEALQKRTRALALLNQASQAFSSTLNPDQVLAAVLEKVRDLLNITASSIWIVDPETQELVCRQATGPRCDVVAGWRLAQGTGIVGWVVQHGESLIVADALADKRHFRAVDEQTGVLLRSVLSVPLRAEQTVIGVLQVLDTEAGRFDATDLPLLESLAASAAIAVENARLYQQAQQEIEERKQAEEALRESEERFRRLYEQAPLGYQSLDAEGYFIDVNQAWLDLLGYPRDQVIGRWFGDFLAPQEVDAFKQRLPRFKAAGEVHVDLEMVQRAGSTIIVHIDGRIGHDEHGQFKQTHCILHDITERKRAQEALRESEEKLKGAQALGRIGNWEFNVDNQKITWSDEVYRLYERDPALGPPTAEEETAYYAPEQVEILREYARRAIEEGEEFEYDLQAKLPSGTLAHFSATMRPAKDEGGRVIRLFGTVQDITERKRAEEALKRRVTQMALINDIASKIAAATELESVLECAARLVQENFGYHHVALFTLDRERDELVMRARAGEFAHLFPPQHRIKLGEGMVGWVGVHGETLLANDVDAEPRYANFYPDALPTRAELSVPIRVGEEIVGALDVQSDQPNAFDENDVLVMETLADQIAVAVENARLYQELRQRAEGLEQRVQERTAQLQGQYARLEAILSSTSDGIVVTGGRGQILLANPVAQAWLGTGVQLNAPTTLPAGDVERLQEAMRDLAARAAERPEILLELTGLDLQLNAAPIAETGGESATAVVAVHDVSQLKSLDRLKSQFVSNVSHELRTPVTTIKLYAALLRGSKPEKWPEYLDALEQEANRQAKLVEGVLQVSRMDAGRMKLKLQPASLDELGEAVVASHQALAQERGLALEHRLAEERLAVLVDRERMMQVLNNLVENAIHYTPQGKVKVAAGRVEMEGRMWATIGVSDTGMGIPEDELSHIFDRFFRGEQPRQMQMPGSGLGLAIVKEIVELHGGRITVESQVGAGSTFIVWLPLVEEQQVEWEDSRDG
jgi:PAS domain S-box-containing protein